MSSTLEEIQTYWQVASITHFFHCFHPKLKDNTFFYQDLEAALLDPEYSWNPKGGRLLDDIIEALVIMYWEDDMPSSISKAFRKMIRDELVEADGKDNPLVEKTITTPSGEIRETWKDINVLPVQTKLDIIQRMCDYVLSARPTIIKEFSVSKLRIRPVGTDSKGFAYWYFHGNRLYRQRFKALKVSVDRLEDVEEAKKTAIKEEIENKSKAKSKPGKVGKDSNESNVKKKSPSKSDKSPTKKPSAKRSKTPKDSKTSVVSRKISDYFVSSKSPSLDSIGSNLNLIAPRGPSKLDIKISCDDDISKVPLPVKQELWSVICDTPIEWEELIRVLIASREKVDLQLSTKLVGYLPEVREAYDRKELTILGRDKRCTLRTRKDQADKNLLLDKKLRSNLTPINYTELSGDEDESDENQVPPKDSSESEDEQSDEDEDSTGEENHERPNIRRSRRAKNIQTYHEKALAARYNKEKKKRNAIEELPSEKKKTKATIIRERQTNF